MNIIPEPIKMTLIKEEKFIIKYSGMIILSGIQEECEFLSAAILQEEISDVLGFNWEITRGCVKKGCIILEGTNETISEEYKLVIDKDNITIKGDKKGIWYGVQTLRQLIRTEGAMLDGLCIEDKPGMPNRGFYHDITRGRIPTLEEMKRMVDHLAFYKMNQLQLYVEHSFLFEGFSEIWRDDTPLSPQDILELDEYCKNRHIELIPSLASFGHLYKVLRTKTYKDLCEIPDSDSESFSFIMRMEHHTLDVTNDHSFTLVKKMIEEYMPLFSSKYFNVCADETFDLGKGRSKEEADRVGIRELYMGFLKKICGLIIENGRIPMFWGDIICRFPEALSELPKGTICLNWGYSPEQDENETMILKKADAVQYVCPGVSGWNSLVNNIKGSYENIKRMCTYGYRHGAVGVLNTDWGDYGHINHPEFSTIGMIYGAAFSWNPHIPMQNDINKKISILEYGDKEGKIADIITELSDCSIYTWFFAVVYKEQRCKTVPTGHSWLSIDRVQWEEIHAAGEKLLNLELKLYESIKHMEKDKRAKIAAYILAADGIHIWNQIGLAVKKHTENKENIINRTGAYIKLAEQLECWYRKYKLLWHSTSRESELYRIGEVIFWYADFLREL